MNFFQKFFRHFFAGLAVLIPLIITIGIIVWIFNFLNRVVGLESILGKILKAVDFIPHVSKWFVVLLGYLIVIAIIALIGRAAARVEHEKKVSRKISDFFNRIPLLNRIYNGVEQIWNFVFKKDQSGLSKFGAVVVFDLAGIKTFGLLASEKKFVMEGRECVLIFMPSSPIPATGFTYWVPVEKVKRCDVSLESFAKVHVSLGVLSSEVFPTDLGLRSFDQVKKRASKMGADHLKKSAKK